MTGLTNNGPEGWIGNFNFGPPDHAYQNDLSSRRPIQAREKNKVGRKLRR